MLGNGLKLHANAWGPVNGKRASGFVLGDSQVAVVTYLLDLFEKEGVVPFALHGDGAYPMCDVLYKAIGDGLAWDVMMNAMRTSVEWGYADIVNHFSFLDFFKNLKMFLQPIEEYWIVGGFLANLRCCLYGNQMSNYFDNPARPSLEEYTSWADVVNQ